MREPRPFFRKQTRSWYVMLGKDFVPLGRDKAEAFDQYHELMTKRRQQTVTAADSVSKLLDLYWQWCEINLATTTCDRRKPVLKSFCLHVGPKLLVRRLRPFHVQEWLTENYPKASDTYRHTLITVIKGAMQWAAEMGYIEHSPIAKMKKPAPAVRQDFVPADLWKKVLDSATDQEFRDFLTVMLSSGARVQEMFNLEARHLSGRSLVLKIKESKGRKRSRVIWLPQSAFGIVTRLADQWPEGKLFRNRGGKPWDRNALRCRFRRLKALLKMPSLTATTLRHSFAHHRLTSGQDSLVVSKLMGHVDGRMLATRYGHLEQNSEFMSAEANRFAT